MNFSLSLHNIIGTDKQTKCHQRITLKGVVANLFSLKRGSCNGFAANLTLGSC